MELKERISLLSGYKWMDDAQMIHFPSALVQLPSDTELSEDAVDTIRHFCRYRKKQDGFVLLSDRVVVCVDAENAQDMIEQANQEAAFTIRSHRGRDSTAYDTEDGCGLLEMGNGKVFAFRPSIIHHSHYGWGPELEARAECLWACERRKIVAVVFYNILMRISH